MESPWEEIPTRSQGVVEKIEKIEPISYNPIEL
jgi:hypothetical protein